MTTLATEQSKIKVLDELMQDEDWQDETAQIILGALKEDAESIINRLTRG